MWSKSMFKVCGLYFYFGKGRSQVGLIALWDIVLPPCALMYKAHFGKIGWISRFSMTTDCIWCTVNILQKQLDAKKNCLLSSFSCPTDTSNRLSLNIHNHINLSSSTVHSYFELVCLFRDLGEATGPIFQTQSQGTFEFMMPVNAVLFSAAVEVHHPAL